MRIGTLGIALATLAFSIVYLVAIADLPAPLSPEDIGPRRFPTIIAVLLIGLALWLLLELWVDRRPPKALERSDWRSALLFVMGVAYVAAIPATGFYVATVIWVGIAVWLLGGRWLAPLTALGFAAFVFLVFETLLGVPTP